MNIIEIKISSNFLNKDLIMISIIIIITYYIYKNKLPESFDNSTIPTQLVNMAPSLPLISSLQSTSPVIDSNTRLPIQTISPITDSNTGLPVQTSQPMQNFQTVCQVIDPNTGLPVQTLQPMQNVQTSQPLQQMQNVQTSQLLQKVQTLQPLQQMQKIQTSQSSQSMPNGQTSQLLQKVQTSQPSQNVQTLQPLQQIQKIQTSQSSQSMLNDQTSQPMQNVQIINSDTNPNYALKYLNVLILELYTKKIINFNDIENIKMKLESQLLTISDVILSLEKIKIMGQNENDLKYNELEQKMMKPIGGDISNDWSNSYTILNQSLWQLPMKRPPVCVASEQCSVCPTDSSTYPLNLQKWDQSRNITANEPKISKLWIENQ
jgi:hypothetical protein